MASHNFLMGYVFLAVSWVSCRPGPAPLKEGGAQRPYENRIGIKDLSEREYIFNSLDNRAVLMRLFDHPEFGNDSEAIWKPNYSERMHFDLSHDHKCHTSIDTILFYNDSRDNKCAVIIFETYQYNGIRTGACHFCGVPTGIALLELNEKKQWELYRFEKQLITVGNWGGDGQSDDGISNRGKFSLKQIGNKWTCLSIKQGINGNSGEFTGYETLYSIERYQLSGFANETLSNLLFYNYSETHPLFSENGFSGEDKTTRDIRLIKQEKGYYAIEMTTVFNGKKKIEFLNYDENRNTYDIK